MARHLAQWVLIVTLFNSLIKIYEDRPFLPHGNETLGILTKISHNSPYTYSDVINCSSDRGVFMMPR